MITLGRGYRGRRGAVKDSLNGAFEIRERRGSRGSLVREENFLTGFWL